MLDAFADSGLAFTPLFDTGLASWDYGFYFTWWDRPMGTEHSQYLRRFAATTHASPGAHQMKAGTGA